jgi:hypothetical protein
MRAVWRRAIVVVLFAVLVAAVAWMVWGPDVSDGVVGKANVVGGLAGIAALVGGIWAVWPRKAVVGPESTPVTEDQFRAALAYLARETLSYWREQAKARRITTPAPALVSWRWADREAAPPVAEVVGDTSPLVLLTDRVVSELRCDLYEVLPEPGRIVILGGPGAGKTTAMLLLLIDVLAERAKVVKAGGDEAGVGPVPAWLTLGGWNPAAVGLLEYAAAVLDRDYPGLAAYAGPGTALELLGSGRVALFMDGLDEIPDGVRGPALEAIDRLAAEARVVVTSRPEEYRSASELHRLWDAAVIDLQPVDLEHACEFLLFQQAGARRAAWEKVVDHMRGHPDGVAARTLRNPLALSLARDTYTHTNAGPQALMDFPTSDALLKHLLVRSLEVAYPDSEERAHAVRWLSWIAEKLNGQRDIRWWDIPGWMTDDDPRLVRKTRLVVGLAAGLVGGLGAGLLAGLVGGLVGGLVAGLVGGLVVVLVVGLGAGFVAGLVVGRRRYPETLLVHWPTWLQLKRLVIQGLGVALVGGLVVGLAAGLVVVLVVGLADGLVAGLGAGLAGGLVGGLISVLFNLINDWSRPFPMTKASSPSDVHRQDYRRTVVFVLGLGLAVGLVVGLVGGLAVGLMGGLAGGLVLGLVGGLAAGLAGGLGGGLAAGLVGGLVDGFGVASELALMERLWARRGSSVRFVALLRVAQERQVLRQVGAVYQLRHAELQDLLAYSRSTHGVALTGADE